MEECSDRASRHLISMTTGILWDQLQGSFQKPDLVLEGPWHLQRKHIGVLGACLSPCVSGAASWAHTSLLSMGSLCPSLARALGIVEVTRPTEKELGISSPCTLSHRAPHLGEGTAIRSAGVLDSSLPESTHWTWLGASTSVTYPSPAPVLVIACLSRSSPKQSPGLSTLPPPIRKASVTFPRYRSDRGPPLPKLFGKMGPGIPPP